MNDDDKLALSYCANVAEIMAIGSLALATGQLWIFAGFLGVFVDVGRKGLNVLKEERLGKKLTPKDIAVLKTFVARAQTELNNLMKHPEVARNDTLYEMCDTAHKRLHTIRNKLNRKSAKKLRTVDQTTLQLELTKLERMLKQAKRGKR